MPVDIGKKIGNNQPGESSSGLFGSSQNTFGGIAFTASNNNGPKPKGVGYSTGVGQTWDVNAYLKSKQAKNSQVIRIIDIIRALVSTCQDENQ